MNRTITSRGGRAPPGQIRRCFLENLIRALQLADFALQLFQALALVGRQAATLPGVPLGDGCSGPCSRTIRIARSRASGEYRVGRAIGSILSRKKALRQTRYDSPWLLAK